MIITMELLWFMFAMVMCIFVWHIKRNLWGDGFMVQPNTPNPFRLKHAEWTDPE